MWRTILAALAAVALVPAPAHAWTAQKGAPTTSSQVLMTSFSSATSGLGTRFYPVGYGNNAAASYFKSGKFPVSGKFKSIRFYIQTPPTGAQTWAATLYKNGAATGLTCIINASSIPVGICTLSLDVIIAAGDDVGLAISPSGSPTNSIFSASFVFAPTAPNDTVIFAQNSGGTFSNSSTTAIYPLSGAAPGTTGGTRIDSLPDGGTIDKLYVSSTAPGTGTSYDYSLAKNGVVTALTWHDADTATDGSDTTHSVTVAAGDDVTFWAAPTGTPTASTATFGVRYVLNTVGAYPIMATGKIISDSATVTTFYPASGGNNTGSTTESNVQHISDSQTITKMVVKLTFAPGAGKSRTFTLRRNGVDVLACPVTDTNTTNTTPCTGSIAINDNDLLSVSDVPTGSPTAGVPSFSFLATR